MSVLTSGNERINDLDSAGQRKASGMTATLNSTSAVEFSGTIIQPNAPCFVRCDQCYGHVCMLLQAFRFIGCMSRSASIRRFGLMRHRS